MKMRANDPSDPNSVDVRSLISQYETQNTINSFLLPSVTKAVKSTTGQKLLKQAKKSAIKAGISTATDVLAGENIKKSAGKNLKKASVDVLEKMREITPRKKKFRKKKKLYNLFD